MNFDSRMKQMSLEAIDRPMVRDVMSRQSCRELPRSAMDGVDRQLNRGRSASMRTSTFSSRSVMQVPKDRSVRLRVMPEQSNDYRVVVFGAGGVGKSSLVLRFVRGTFRESYIPTIEDTYRQVISCNKQVCTLQITDTTGSHQFPAMQRLSISKGHAFILVYSITSRQSLEELKPIYNEIVQIKTDLKEIPVMLVGNKCDETSREVPTREAAELAKSWNCAFLETSAKTNHNVKELFQELLQLEKRRTMSLQLETKKTKSQKRKEKLKGKCSIM